VVDVHLDGVSVRYGRDSGTAVAALVDVSLHDDDGEFFTLVGPSGCGKTTTLRAIAGFETPSTGTVRFGDQSLAGVPPEDRDVGIVFQNYALFPHMTVAENVAYGLHFSDPPGGVGRDERVAELLDLVDLSGFDERDPDELSGGQQQRVALARALAPGPEVLLLDEPMSALDARLRERLRLQVKAIQQELDITTVYVTHDQEEALAVSDRVAVLSDGRVEQIGTPEAIYRRPATRFVAGFVGDNTLFEGAVTDRDDGKIAVVAVEDARFRVALPDGTGPGVGETLAFCVRPEGLVRDAGENRFVADVETVEFLGETFRVHLDWQGRPITFRTDEQPADDRVVLGFEPDAAHVFEG
jgi:thiamine transport system ATP-binding protein